ncbi:MAG TPA: DEDD exonuclease domain-containing protein [Acidimicrobiales bacterium]|nr:DEDD exonuclease domain-containing protein [Acidimicrobiales bacterium]
MQRSFDDLGTPLADVTFVVIDLETTGGSPQRCGVTEVGAVKYRGGQCLGTFQTLVDPGVSIPPEIVYLTGITDVMVTAAPPMAAVLPHLLEFVGSAVVVGHNVRFDLSFLQEHLRRAGYPKLRNPAVDTCALARRLVREEVPNCTLATLSRHFRTAVEPCHRALDDAKATAEVLHCLLERAGSLGVLALDDLLALPKTAAHPQVAKLPWVARLPRAPGVYVFRDRAGRPLYVGKAVDLRRRVRSYFAGDDRRKIGPLLREAQSVDHRVCAHELEAEVVELRMIHELRPRYNSRDKNPAAGAYVKFTLPERFPRLSVVRTRRADGSVYLGPLPSHRVAGVVVEALQAALPIRRCGGPRGRPNQDGPCPPAQLGVAACPCSGHTIEEEYRRIVDTVSSAMLAAPALVLGPLHERMRRLADSGRFEEAAATRDRAAAFARAVERQRRLDALLEAGQLEVEIDGGGGAVIDDGCLVDAWPAGRRERPEPLLELWTRPASPPTKEASAEALVIASWLDRRGSAVRVVSCSGTFAWPSSRLPRFEPRSRPRADVRPAA